MGAEHLDMIETSGNYPGRLLCKAHGMHDHPAPGGGEIRALIYVIYGVLEAPGWAQAGKIFTDPGINVRWCRDMIYYRLSVRNEAAAGSMPTHTQNLHPIRSEGHLPVFAWTVRTRFHRFLVDNT